MILNKFRWGLTSLFEFGRVWTELGGIWTSLDVDRIWRSLNKFGQGSEKFE